jgi:hypothetical protein
VNLCGDIRPVGGRSSGKRERSRLPWVAAAGVVLAAAAITVARPAQAQERPGTLSLGIQGQYGLIAGPSDLASDFDRGAGFALRIRYALGGPQAFGISFESQTFQGDPDEIDVDPAPDRLKLANATLEYIRYFNRGEGRSQYFVAGGGLFHPSERRVDGSVVLRSDGLILLAGGGLEAFVRRTTAIDLSVRANALIGGDGIAATIEVAVGPHFYLIK